MSDHFWIHSSDMTLSMDAPMIDVGRLGSIICSLLNVASAGAEKYSRRLSERITDGYAAKFDHHDDPGGHAGLGFRRSPEPPHTLEIDPATIGTAVAQQNLRSVLSFCNSPQMNAPEAYIQFKPGLFSDSGEVTDQSTEQFLREFMHEYHQFIVRVLTVLPPS